MSDLQVSAAEQKRRSNAAAMLNQAATTLEIYGLNPDVQELLNDLAEKIRHGQITRP